MENWQILCAVGLALVAAELATGGFVMLPMGVAFLLTAGAALWVPGWEWLLGILGVNAVLVFAFFRKFVTSRFEVAAQPTGAEAMIGKQALVTEAIRAVDNSGYVKLYGDSWKAVSREGRDIDVGAKVTIVGIDGNKVIVS